MPRRAARLGRHLRVLQRRDPLPIRRIDPRHRRVHLPEPLLDAGDVDQRRDHGADDHGRRREPGLGEADHRGGALLRLRPPGPQGRGPRADHRQVDRQHVLRGGAKRMVSVDLHSGQIQGFFDGPGRPPDRHAGAGRLDGGQPARGSRGRFARRRPREGGRAVRATSCTPTSPSSTSVGSGVRRTPSRPRTWWATSRGGCACSSTT